MVAQEISFLLALFHGKLTPESGKRFKSWIETGKGNIYGKISASKMRMMIGTRSASSSVYVTPASASLLSFPKTLLTLSSVIE